MESKSAKRVSKEPLMPSPEASVLDLGSFDYAQSPKPAKKPPVNQDVLIANVVKKSLEL